MTTLLFSVLAATSLATAGVAAPSETRSAQSLPSDNLVSSSMNSSATGKFHGVSRLADGGPSSGWDHSDRSLCNSHHWYWDNKVGRCHKNALPMYIIGAGAAGGFIYALSSRGDSSSGQSSVSH